MRLIFIFLLFFPLRVFSQTVTDNFSDGDFTANPAWSGNSDHFIINNSFQLQLNNNVAGTSYLSTNAPVTSGSINNTEWQFWIRMNFSPSNNNFSRVYLVSDNSDLSAPLNGYYLKFGENLSADPIELYRQNGTASTLLFRGAEGFVASAFAIRVRVTRDNAGLWTVAADASGGFNFIQQGTATDAEFTNSSFFGVFCTYTVSNATRFFFDDFYVGPLVVDDTPPVVERVSVISGNELEVVFSEGVSSVTAQTSSNYTVNRDLGNPLSAVFPGASPSVVKLTFSEAFTEGLTYSLNVKNISDNAGNVLVSSNHDFLFYEAKQFDIVFNEIMADPDPQVALPRHEYVELYNSTPFSINVKNWVFQHGNSSRILPDAVIPADSFLVLCNPSALAELADFGNVIAVEGMPVAALANTGSTLTLLDHSGKLIHTVQYSDSWYGDSNKRNGGWSLEQIDHRSPCSGRNNWTASVSPTGGTPGQRNSVYGLNPDTIAPKAVSLCLSSNQIIEIFFSETVSGDGLLVASTYIIDNGIGSPLRVEGESGANSILLFLGTEISPELTYTLSIGGNIFDCSGNELRDQDLIFSEKSADYLDIVINEIMADPDPVVGLPNNEYFELYNRLDYPVNLKNWTVTIGRTTRIFPCISIMPKDYLIVCHSNSADAMAQYGSVASIPSLGSLTNTGTTITLMNPQGKVITSVTYSDSWYNNNNKKDGGWSLEQIDPDNPCAEQENWAASNNTRGGTPGMANSIKAKNSDKKKPELERIAIQDEFTIRVIFDEAMHPDELSDVMNYEIDNGIGNPILAFPVPTSYKEVTLSLQGAIKRDITYTLRVKTILRDCVGNLLESEESTGRFAIPDSNLLPSDIIINEILFNPREGGVDYVELYNRSNKILDLNQLRLSSIDTVTNQLTSIREIDPLGYLLFPEEYVVLSVNSKIVREQYRVRTKNFKQMESLPQFPNTAGRAVISLKNDTIIDRLYYTDKMHFALLKNLKGVALERIDPERPSQDESNWISASEFSGYGTPGYRNSQYMRLEPGDDPITIEPKVFSPDNDGFNDVVNISYKLDAPGYLGNITIYDSNGRLIRHLMRSELLGTEGTVSWDGIKDNREKASVGIHIIYIEFLTLTGTVKKYKKTCVVATKFR
jgi:hypothetical protein